VPFIDAPRSYSGDSIAVAVGCADDGAEIWVRILEDDAFPALTGDLERDGFTLATGQLMVHGTQTVQVMARRGENRSAVVSSRIARVNPDYKVGIKFPYANQYAAGGDRALIDGVRGEGADFRTGDWQGYHGKGAVVTVDLGAVHRVREMSIGVLQDVKSWIWAPNIVLCRTSLDSLDFDLYGSEAPDMDPFDYSPQTQRLRFKGDREARYLQVQLSQFNGGEIPEWHPGRWNPTWVFADEFGFDVEPVE